MTNCIYCNINPCKKHSKYCSISCRDKAYYRKNRQQILSKKKEYYERNKKVIKKRVQIRHDQRIQEDIQYKLRWSLRNRLRCAIKRNLKTGSAVKDLGCTIADFKSHIESLWQDGMNWNNWTTNGWHIDHIKPLRDFDLTNPEELKRACHYSNLQPLWADDNYKKEYLHE